MPGAAHLGGAAPSPQNKALLVVGLAGRTTAASGPDSRPPSWEEEVP